MNAYLGISNLEDHPFNELEERGILRPIMASESHFISMTSAQNHDYKANIVMKMYINEVLILL